MDRQRVIKSDSLRELGHKVVFDFEDFQQRCDDHLLQTRQQAQQLLSQTERKVVTLEEQARQAGYDAGYTAGMKQAESEIQTRANAQAQTQIRQGMKSGQEVIESLAKSVADAKIEWNSRWETTAVKLSASIAERILRAELAQRPELSQTMIRDLLEIASSESRLIARIHPEDAPFLEDADSSPEQFPRFRQMVEFQPDPTLNRGDCVVELEQGVLDGRVSTQLQRLIEELVPQEESPPARA